MGCNAQTAERSLAGSYVRIHSSVPSAVVRATKELTIAVELCPEK